MKLMISTIDSAVLFYGDSIRVTDTGMYVIDERITIPPSNNFKIVEYTGEVPEDFASRKYCYFEDKGFAINERYIREQLQAAINSKVTDLDTTCNQTIEHGADVTLTDGETLHFTLDAQDQANLTAICFALASGATKVMWHEDDQTKHCRIFSAEDAQLFINTLTNFKTYHITYFRDARIYIRSLTDVNEVMSFNYGDPLPEEFKSDALKFIEASMKSGE